jgi:hypothetical protein
VSIGEGSRTGGLAFRTPPPGGANAPSEKKACKWAAASARGDQARGDDHGQGWGRRRTGAGPGSSAACESNGGRVRDKKGAHAGY